MKQLRKHRKIAMIPEPFGSQVIKFPLFIKSYKRSSRHANTQHLNIDFNYAFHLLFYCLSEKCSRLKKKNYIKFLNNSKRLGVLHSHSNVSVLFTFDTTMFIVVKRLKIRKTDYNTYSAECVFIYHHSS